MTHRLSWTLVLALLAGPLASAELDLKMLDAKCEAAREARLKPLRDAEIARCKADERNDPAFCDRFYSDLGNITRNAQGKIVPRMFDDLPECVAARQARQLSN